MDGDHYAQFHIENMLKTSQPTRQAGTTISYNTTIENDRTYYQTQCDYPGCDSGYEGTEHEYWETPDLAAEDATNNGMWLTLTDWQGGKTVLLPQTPPPQQTRIHARLRLQQPRKVAKDEVVKHFSVFRHLIFFVFSPDFPQNLSQPQLNPLP